jgi:Mg-chelatase subunit ChlD
MSILTLRGSKRFFILLAAWLVAAALLTGPALAGNGSFDNGEHNFCVSVRFNASAAQLQQIRTAFQNASQVVADATDGQHRFGTVTLVNGSGASQSAEFWVHPGQGRAYATAGDYGVRGQHVNLWFQSNFQTGNGADGDAYTLAHEHVHHSYGVLDEYSGPGVASAECAPPPDTPTLNYSLMDNYFVRGGRAGGTTYTLNELCVAANHDPDGDTYQESFNGQSAWETLAAHPTRSATPPTGLPVDAPPAAHTVTFRTGIGGLRVMLLLDRSGSMGGDNRLVFAKRGAGQFINVLRNGDGLGVASFSSSARVDFPLTTITGSGTKDAARAAVDALIASGSTNIGGGLISALGEITAQSDRSCNEIIVLLSDGDHNTGTDPLSVIPDLVREGVTVLTAGVGSGISTTGQATLETIARRTGGRFFRVANSFDLIGLFLRLASESIGDGLLTRAPDALASGEVREIPVQMEPGVTLATFALALAEESDAIQLTVESPSGLRFETGNESPFAALGGAETFTGSNSQVIQVPAPEVGIWTLVVSAGAVSDGRFEALAFAAHDGTQLDLALVDTDLPRSFDIRATPLFEGEAVVGASVKGLVSRPDGTPVDILLLDDGLAEHADAVAGDGIYGARFDQIDNEGTYTVELVAAAEAGAATTFTGEDLFGAGLPTPEPIPSFTRLGSASLVVSKTVGPLRATVEYGPEVLDLTQSDPWVSAWVELPEGLDPASIDLATVAVTAVDGQPIEPIPAALEAGRIGDFDTDGIADLHIQLDREALERVLVPGMRALRLEGTAGGQLFTGERFVGVLTADR